MTDQVVAIGGDAFGIDDVVAVARGASVLLDPEARRRMQASRAVVDAAADGAAVYGLNTGLGAAVDTPLGPEDIAAFQRRAVRSRAVAVGELMSVEEVRAALVARLAGVARGASGLSPGFADTIIAMLNEPIHPRVRRIGSLGESDLAQMAALFLPLAGGGTADLAGRDLPGPEALRLAGILVPDFAPKDAIALLNANAASIGSACLMLTDLERALQASLVAGALSHEAFRANLSPIDPRVVVLRPAPGQAEGAARLRALLEGSDLFEKGKARRLQDPLSFRCLAPVHGVALLRWQDARAAVEADLAGAGDSPAVLPDSGEMLSTVNFDTTALALACEALGLACSHVAALAVFRAAKLMSPAFSGLPRFLTRHGGSHNGFATVQKTASALEAEIRHLALPVGAMVAPVADGVEDYAPMTPRIVEKTRQITRRMTALAAVELTVAAQAVDLRGGIRLGRYTRAAHAFVRRFFPPLDDDRPLGDDFEHLALLIRAGDFAKAVGEA